MTNWGSLFQSHFDSTKTRDELTELLLLPGAQISQIQSIVSRLGFDTPEEFLELYSTFNGVGHKQGENELDWFKQLSSLEEFGESCRMWMEEHEEVSMRYFPFIDFNNGESAGYMHDENGNRLDGVFFHYTGAYEYDEDQPWTEFIVRETQSIEDFLMECS